MTQGSALLQGEDRLHWLLGRLVHSYARLDLNIGLQLRSLSHYRAVDVDELLKPETSTFKPRLRRLRTLSLEVYGQRNRAAREAFERWFRRAEAARALRNNYAHGRWGLVSVQQPDLFIFVALSWVFDPEKMDPPVQLSLAELEEQVLEVESLGRDFLALQRTFESIAGLPVNGALREGS